MIVKYHSGQQFKFERKNNKEQKKTRGKMV